MNYEDNATPALQRLQAGLPAAIRQATEEAVLYVHGKVPEYPPPPGESSYTRTGTLGRSITTKVEAIGSGAVGSIGTAVVYAGYVIDENRQAWMHRGRWWTLQGVVRGSKDAIIGFYQRAISRLISGR